MASEAINQSIKFSGGGMPADPPSCCVVVVMCPPPKSHVSSAAYVYNYIAKPITAVMNKCTQQLF